MNCFCWMVDWREIPAGTIVRGSHQISDMLRTGCEPVPNLSSDFVERSCAVVITTIPRHQSWIISYLCNLWSLKVVYQFLNAERNYFQLCPCRAVTFFLFGKILLTLYTLGRWNNSQTLSDMHLIRHLCSFCYALKCYFCLTVANYHSNVKIPWVPLRNQFYCRVDIYFSDWLCFQTQFCRDYQSDKFGKLQAVVKRNSNMFLMSFFIEIILISMIAYVSSSESTSVQIRYFCRHHSHFSWLIINPACFSMSQTIRKLKCSTVSFFCSCPIVQISKNVDPSSYEKLVRPSICK